MTRRFWATRHRFCHLADANFPRFLRSLRRRWCLSLSIWDGAKHPLSSRPRIKWKRSAPRCRSQLLEQFEVDDFQAAYSADALYVTTLVLSKVSTSVFYRTITARSSQWILHVLLGIIALWGPAALVLSTVRCSSSPWQDINQECKILVRNGICCCRAQRSCWLDLVSSMAGDHGFGHHS